MHHTQKLALLFLVAIAIAIPSAFAGEQERKPVRSLLEIRQEGVIVQKWETSCAAAALATVLTFSQNDPVTEKFVAGRMLRSHRSNQGEGPWWLLPPGYETVRRNTGVQGHRI